MVIRLHLTGGVTFPPRRNSAVFMRPPPGLPSDSWKHRDRGPRGGCRRPWSVSHKSAGYTLRYAASNSIPSPPKPCKFILETNSLVKKEIINQKRDYCGCNVQVWFTRKTERIWRHVEQRRLRHASFRIVIHNLNQTPHKKPHAEKMLQKCVFVFNCLL